ncbi:MAG TPA: acyl-CoA dehydrogenase, partial [Acidimicrobiales bacterium]|nr:acyl-CoA dehydrogenase [Acidimicrobiales bacterium]
RERDGWLINGEKMWNTGVHTAQHDIVFARTSGTAGDASGITAFLVPTNAEGFKVEEYMWTFNMPTDHARVSLHDVRVSEGAVFGTEGAGLQIVQHFFNENRMRQAASSLGAAQFCVNQSVEYAKVRSPFGTPLSTHQAIQFPLVELQTQCEMVRSLIHKTAWLMDTQGAFSQSERVSMCNYWSNRLCCQAADQAMQVHGGLGYSRHKPFEHIYRHHRRYRITEGSEEIQMRRVAGYMFGFMKQNAPKGMADD